MALSVEVARQVVAFSGGKDSTALVLRMAELGEDFTCLFTPTQDELPDLLPHLTSIVERIQRPIVFPPNKSLLEWIEINNGLPNFRMRWCTRQIKIRPCIDWLVQHPGTTLCVGLRADEEHREGLYGDYAQYRYPMREWGWTIDDVYGYLAANAITIPKRTDCALCYGQRLIEWYDLWREHPDRYQQGVDLEAKYGHTFRSSRRDSWPAGLADLRQQFEAGRVPPDTRAAGGACRVCSL